jgi:hypothetical protein
MRFKLSLDGGRPFFYSVFSLNGGYNDECSTANLFGNYLGQRPVYQQTENKRAGFFPVTGRFGFHRTAHKTGRLGSRYSRFPVP